MNPRAPGWFALGSAVLGACGSGKADTGDSTWVTGTTSGTGTTITATGTTSGTNVGTTTSFRVTTAWSDDGGLPGSGSCGDALAVLIQDPLGVAAWELGMAESGTGGWTGEDCLNGYGAYTVCHPIGTDHTLQEVADCLPGSVVAGSTTLFDASKDPYLTYYLADATSCFVWGADAAYYAALGCDPLQ